MSLEDFKNITEFVQKHHKFAHLKRGGEINESIEAGLSEKLAEFGMNIKYVRCDYDTRFGDVWGITFDRIRFATNSLVMGEIKEFPYDNLFDLAMAYLKGEYKPHKIFIDQ